MGTTAFENSQASERMKATECRDEPLALLLAQSNYSRRGVAMQQQQPLMTRAEQFHLLPLVTDDSGCYAC
jgi:hypothetical protein